MGNFILDKEIEAIKNDRKISKQQIEIEKKKMAISLKEQMKGVNLSSFSTPVKKKISLCHRLNNFIKKIMFIFGFYEFK